MAGLEHRMGVNVLELLVVQGATLEQGMGLWCGGYGMECVN